MNKIEDIVRNNKELLYATINHYRKQINLDEAYDKHVKYQLKQYLLQEVSNFGEKGYTILDNKKLLDILHPDKDNKILSKCDLSRIANYFNIYSKDNTIDYKKGIHLTKDMTIGLYPLYGEYDDFNEYDASYIKLAAYFITSDKNVNKEITDTIWIKEVVH